MKKGTIIFLSLLAVLSTLFTFAEKYANTAPQTDAAAQIVEADMRADTRTNASGNTSGFSLNGLAAFIFDCEDGTQ